MCHKIHMTSCICLANSYFVNSDYGNGKKITNYDVFSIFIGNKKDYY